MSVPESTDSPALVESDVSPVRTWERVLAPPMFVLALGFLLALAFLLTKHPWSTEHPLETTFAAWVLGVLWWPFFLEAVLGFLLRDRRLGFWRPLGQMLLLSVLPPMRLATHSRSNPEFVWLPRLGWRATDKELRTTLEHFFSIPMIVFAALVIPVLAIDYFWSDYVDAHPGLELALFICNNLIWYAFAIEFIVMVSVAEKALRYCISNWIDLAIVVLPMIEAMPVFRLLRLGRLLRFTKIQRMGRLYRLRGLAQRAWRAFVLLGLIHRLLGRSLEKRIAALENDIQKREEELNDLRKQLEDLHRQRAGHGEESVEQPPSEGSLVGEQANNPAS